MSAEKDTRLIPAYPNLAGLPVEMLQAILYPLPELTDYLALQQTDNRRLRQFIDAELAAKRQLKVWITNPAETRYGKGHTANTSSSSSSSTATTAAGTSSSSSTDSKSKVHSVTRLCKLLEFWSSAVKRVLQQQLKDDPANVSVGEQVSSFSPWKHSVTAEVKLADCFNIYPRMNNLCISENTVDLPNEVAEKEARQKKAYHLWNGFNLHRQMPSLDRLEMLMTNDLWDEASRTGEFFPRVLSSISGFGKQPFSFHFCAYRMRYNYFFLAKLFFYLFDVFGETEHLQPTSRLKVVSIFIRQPLSDHSNLRYDLEELFQKFPTHKTTTLSGVEELLLGGLDADSASYLLGSHFFPAVRRLGLVVKNEGLITERTLNNFIPQSTERRQQLTHLSLYTYDSLKQFQEEEVKKEAEQKAKKKSQKEEEEEEVVVVAPFQPLDPTLLAYIKQEFPAVIRFNGQPI